MIFIKEEIRFLFGNQKTYTNREFFVEKNDSENIYFLILLIFS